MLILSIRCYEVDEEACHPGHRYPVVIVIVISTDLGGPLLVLVVTVMRTCGLALGNELIACSILVLSRFRLYVTTFFINCSILRVEC